MKIGLKRFEYGMVKTDPLLEAALIVPYRSGYYAEVEFSRPDKPIVITDISLVFSNGLRVPADRFDPIKLPIGGVSKQAFNFFVKESRAIKEGSFELQAMDNSGKVFKCEGRLPLH